MIRAPRNRSRGAEPADRLRAVARDFLSIDDLSPDDRSALIEYLKTL